MNKKIVYFIIGSLILAVVVAIAIVRNELTDRVNPFLDMEDAYAQVEKGTQNYENVEAYKKDGERLPYKLDFNGFDPDKEYVIIKHKGKYVKEIHYINKLPFE